MVLSTRENLSTMPVHEIGRGLEDVVEARDTPFANIFCDMPVEQRKTYVAKVLGRLDKSQDESSERDRIQALDRNSRVLWVVPPIRTAYEQRVIRKGGYDVTVATLSDNPQARVQKVGIAFVDIFDSDPIRAFENLSPLVTALKEERIPLVFYTTQFAVPDSFVQGVDYVSSLMHGAEEAFRDVLDAYAPSVYERKKYHLLDPGILTFLDTMNIQEFASCHGELLFAQVWHGSRGKRNQRMAVVDSALYRAATRRAKIMGKPFGYDGDVSFDGQPLFPRKRIRKALDDAYVSCYTRLVVNGRTITGNPIPQLEVANTLGYQGHFIEGAFPNKFREVYMSAH